MAGYTEPLDSDVEICVPEDEYGLQAIDILDPSWVSWVLMTEMNWNLLFLLCCSNCCNSLILVLILVVDEDGRCVHLIIEMKRTTNLIINHLDSLSKASLILFLVLY